MDSRRRGLPSFSFTGSGSEADAELGELVAVADGVLVELEGMGSQTAPLIWYPPSQLVQVPPSWEHSAQFGIADPH